MLLLSRRFSFPVLSAGTDGPSPRPQQSMLLCNNSIPHLRASVKGRIRCGMEIGAHVFTWEGTRSHMGEHVRSEHRFAPRVLAASPTTGFASGAMNNIGSVGGATQRITPELRTIAKSHTGPRREDKDTCLSTNILGSISDSPQIPWFRYSPYRTGGGQTTLLLGIAPPPQGANRLHPRRRVIPRPLQNRRAMGGSFRRMWGRRGFHHHPSPGHPPEDKNENGNRDPPGVLTRTPYRWALSIPP